MNEPLKRRSLITAAARPDPIPEEAIAAVAVRNGFAANANTTAAPATDQGANRRQRMPTGRDHQFNVRLRQDTLDFIYKQANGRNIPIAQVIEEMADALAQQQR